jgi:hypothetical protein
MCDAMYESVAYLVPHVKSYEPEVVCDPVSALSKCCQLHKRELRNYA